MEDYDDTGTGEEGSQREPPAPSENSGGKTPGGSGQRDEEPSRTDRGLITTDVFLAIFAGITAAAAMASSAVAIWTACQLGAQSKQTDIAIGKIAALATAAQDQAQGLRDQLAVMQTQAHNTGELIAPARTSASAAMTGVKQQETNFLLDQRPIVNLADCVQNR